MHNAGEWVTATWLGTPVFEKPPLLFWLLRIFGPLLDWSDAALRLPGVIAALLCVGFGMNLAAAGLFERTTGFSGPSHARRHGDGEELPEVPDWTPTLVCALVLGTVTFVLNARRPMTDSLLCAAIMASLWYAWRCVHGGGRGAAIALGAAGGLGVLAKQAAFGPAALVIGLVLLWRRRFGALLVAAVVGLLVAAPWHIAMTAEHGSTFWEVYLGYHVAERAGLSLVGQEDLAFYMRSFFEVDGPVALLLMVGLVLAVWRRAGRETFTALVVGTALVTLVLLHLAGTKLYHYLMPVVPLAAVASVAVIGAVRPGRWIIVLVALVGFFMGPLDPILLDPDFAPDSRAVAERQLAPAPADAELVIWEDYDPAAIWYSRRAPRIWTSNEGFWAVQQSIDMMRRTGAVVWADRAARDRLLAAPEGSVVVVPRQRADSLAHWVDRVVLTRDVTVDEATSRMHRVLVLGAVRRAPATPRFPSTAVPSP